MSKTIKFITFFILLSYIALTASNCSEDKKDSLTRAYLTKLEQERAERNWYMLYDPSQSPFLMDTTVKYEPLKFFEPNPDFIFKSKLFKMENPDSVDVYGTQGTSRQYLRYGYFVLNYKNNNYRLYVYNITTPDGIKIYNIWFKDATNGKETYENGRYLRFQKNKDENFEYTIDFNRAINPICAYSSIFNCPIPTELDSLPFEILAGEKKFK